MGIFCFLGAFFGIFLDLMGHFFMLMGWQPWIEIGKRRKGKEGGGGRISKSEVLVT